MSAMSRWGLTLEQFVLRGVASGNPYLSSEHPHPPFQVADAIELDLGHVNTAKRVHVSFPVLSSLPAIQGRIRHIVLIFVSSPFAQTRRALR